MQSQISFVDSQTLAPKPDINAGQVLISSKELAWDGIYIEQGENEEFTPDDVTVAQHYFAMNIGPAFEWEWKDGQTFKSHRYETGDLWVNPAGVPFSHRINQQNQFILLTIEPQKVVELLPDHSLLERQAFRRQHQAKDKHLQTLIRALLVEAEMGGPNGRLYADTLSTALVTHFVNHYSLPPSVNLLKPHPTQSKKLAHVIDYIEGHLTADLSLSDLSLEAGLSKFHFSRLFKDEIGLTPHKYVLKRRIEKATQLLKQGETVAQVAYFLGFTDQSHFTRVFKQFKGVTPKGFINPKIR
ncbi:AraC family transcriptional regulator [Acaryochloris sp. IP29b_bin.137]|uniref:AraC family transcriptional regulator n=1 Tax=Acaryochloris sp. IP29b_bin.137 TaxID=2969217 RepID=UPI0026142F12|nr:AraC family transcriptional regulator [Acaryochloris sp. IP29b_bin.137]